MKRLVQLLLIWIFTTMVHAGGVDPAVAIMEQVTGALVQKSKIRVWTNDANQLKVITASERLVVAKTCDDADILIFRDYEDVPEACTHKVVFVTRYRLLKRYEKAVGAFYWSKGRPQLLFIQKGLKHHNITLPENLQKYAAVSL